MIIASYFLHLPTHRLVRVFGKGAQLTPPRKHGVRRQCANQGESRHSANEYGEGGWLAGLLASDGTAYVAPFTKSSEP